MSWIGAVSEGIGAISDWGQMIYSNEKNEAHQKQSQRWQERMALEAYQRDIDFWNMQNEYNSPSAQRQRLEAAGISPWTAYGGMSASSTAGFVKSPVPNTVPPPYINARPPNGLNTSAIIQSVMQMREHKLNERIADANLAALSIENEGKMFDNFIKQWQIENALPFQKEEMQFKKDNQWKKEEQELQEFMQERLRKIERYGQEKTVWGYENKGRELENTLKGLSINEMYQVLDFYKYKKELAQKDIQLKGQQSELNRFDIGIQDLRLQYEEYKKKMRDDYGINEKDPWYIWESKKKIKGAKDKGFEINIPNQRTINQKTQELWDYLFKPQKIKAGFSDENWKNW